MDNLYNIAHKNNMDAGIWNTAAHFYYCSDEMKANIVPDIVNHSLFIKN